MEETISKMPQLIIIFGAEQGKTLTLTSSHILFGRAEDADFIVDSPKISRHHAEIKRSGPQWLLNDLNSKNGTFVNGNQIRQHESVALRDQDRIQLASVFAFEFRDPDTTADDSEFQIYTPGLWIDIDKREVFIRSQKLMPPLSDNLFRLLYTIYLQPEIVFTNREVIETIWPDDIGGVTDSAIDTLFYRLNQRLRELDSEHDYIVSLRGMGRKFVQRGD